MNVCLALLLAFLLFYLSVRVSCLKHATALVSRRLLVFSFIKDMKRRDAPYRVPADAVCVAGLAGGRRQVGGIGVGQGAAWGRRRSQRQGSGMMEIVVMCGSVADGNSLHTRAQCLSLCSSPSTANLKKKKKACNRCQNACMYVTCAVRVLLLVADTSSFYHMHPEFKDGMWKLDTLVIIWIKKQYFNATAYFSSGLSCSKHLQAAFTAACHLPLSPWTITSLRQPVIHCVSPVILPCTLHVREAYSSTTHFLCLIRVFDPRGWLFLFFAQVKMSPVPWSYDEEADAVITQNTLQLCPVISVGGTLFTRRRLYVRDLHSRQSESLQDIYHGVISPDLRAVSRDFSGSAAGRYMFCVSR